MVWVPVQSLLTEFVPMSGSVLDSALMRSKVAIGAGYSTRMNIVEIAFESSTA